MLAWYIDPNGIKIYIYIYIPSKKGDPSPTLVDTHVLVK